jgi:hypothetical protein
LGEEPFGPQPIILKRPAFPRLGSCKLCQVR